MLTWRVGEVADGRYEVTAVHEHGGMGVVYRIRHLVWDIDLAVKSPRPDAFRSAEDRQRFVAEAETWVSLGLHPHVCNCYYVRVLDDVPRVFAEYVPGGSLHEWIADRRLYDGDRPAVLARILDIAIQAAWGLGYAHDRGLVHRDVKPANILLDPADGEGSAVTAKITDFGLALADGAALDDGGWMTPRYASPEQAAGDSMGQGTDVYSLAVSVLEMCVGEATWLAGPAAGAALDAYRADGVADGVAGAVDIPPPLGDLLERCLCLDPASRPGSMADVAAELIGIYQGVTGNAYPRPEPATADLLADELNNRAVSLLDLGREADAGEAFAQALAADPHHARASYNAGLTRWRRGGVTDDALLTELEATRADSGDQWEVQYALAQVHLERGDLAAGRELLGALSAERPDEPEVRSALRVLRSGEITDARRAGEWQVPWPRRPPPRSLRAQLAGSAPGAIPLALTPDGRLLAAGGWDGAVRVYDVRAGQCVRTLSGHRKPVHAVDITPDGHFAVSVCENETVRFWDLSKRRLGGSARSRLLYASPSPPSWAGDEDRSRTGSSAVRIASDGALVLYTDVEGTFRVWDARTRQVRIQDKAPVHGLAEVSGDGRWALSVRSLRLGPDREDAVRLWDLREGRCERELRPGHKPAVTALCFSPDGRYAATAGFHEIRVWDMADGRCTHVLVGGSAPRTLSFSADARFLLSGSGYEDVVRCWELDRGRCLRTFRAHYAGTTVVRLDAGNRSGFSAGQDGVVRRWELPGAYRGAPLLSRPRAHGELSRLGERVDALIGEAEQAITAGEFPTALGPLRQARAIEGYERAPRVMSAWWGLGRRAVRTGPRAAWSSQSWPARGTGPIDLSGDGRLAVSASDEKILLWDTESGRCLRALAGHEGAVRSVCLSADGRRLLSAGEDGQVRLWETGTGECQHLLTLDVRVRKGDSLPVRFGACGGRVVVAGPGDTIRLWDPRADSPPRKIRPVYGGAISDLRLSDDGRLAVAVMQGQVALLDLGTGEVAHHLRGESFLTMEAASLSADGRLALAGDFDGRVRVWDARTGVAVQDFDGPPQGGFHTVRMTADGRFAVRAGYRSYMTVWDVRDGRCVRVLDGHEKGVQKLALTPDGRFLLAGHNDHLRLWELDWDLAVQDAADWDEGAAPYLEAFRRRHGSRWTHADADDLLRRLQDVGYGWLRADGVRARLGDPVPVDPVPVDEVPDDAVPAGKAAPPAAVPAPRGAGHVVSRLPRERPPRTLSVPQHAKAGWINGIAPGAPIAGYTLLRELGRGGMGAVYLARHEHSGAEVALKVMLPKVAASPEARARFLREAELTRALRHRNIAALHDTGFADGVFYFTTEYCAGGSLDRLLARNGGRLAVRDALRLACQALEGLAHAHGESVVHRDLSPHNILLAETDGAPVAKVADFGLAKAFDQAGLSGLTRTGATAGKPWYMPRQQVINFRHVTPAVDVWALAACVYETLTGTYPRDFPPGKDPWQVILRAEPVPIRRRAPGISPALADVIDEALREKPEGAFRTADEFRRALLVHAG